MYALINNGSVTQYPYSAAQLRADNSQTSFPVEMPDERLAEWGVYRVTPTAAPTVDHTQTLTEATPMHIDGQWMQAWIVTDASDAEVERRTQDEAAAVRAERNERLVASDWTQVIDSPLTTAQSLQWANYRQSLRDITAQAGFPWAIDWPVKP